MSLCFNMRYLALDTWSEGQKTILRIFQVEPGSGANIYIVSTEIVRYFCN